MNPLMNLLKRGMPQFGIQNAPLNSGGMPVIPTTIPKWNMSSVSETEGEIVLYGDVLSQKPIDWWTGEAKEGLYITPQGFMEDLELVKDKEVINVKLNSCGGDLYTGIAICNALKSLKGTVNVIIEGMAASSASLIAQGGDVVKAYPGSLYLIHGVGAVLYDFYQITDLKKIIRDFDASERAAAEIYNARTNLGIETLRNMMTKETVMTGREAFEKGFVDELIEGDDPQMSFNNEKKIIYVNGIEHNLMNYRNISPMDFAAPTNYYPTQRNNIQNHATLKNKKEGEIEIMNLADLKEKYPQLVAEIEKTAKKEAIQEERNRIQDIENISNAIGDLDLINDAKFGEKACSAQELSFRAIQKNASAGNDFLKNHEADIKNSKIEELDSIPNGGVPNQDNKTPEAQAAKLSQLYNSQKGGN